MYRFTAYTIGIVLVQCKINLNARTALNAEKETLKSATSVASA